MIRRLVILLIPIFFSCHLFKKQVKQPEKIQLTDSEKKKGNELMQLVGTRDCTICHAVDIKLIGPSFSKKINNK